MLIHKTKPSQAALLLEDAHDKQLVKQLQHPGEAILVTDYGAPMIVTMPLCTRQDLETVATMIGERREVGEGQRAKSEGARVQGTGFKAQGGDPSPCALDPSPCTLDPEPLTINPAPSPISLHRIRADQLRKLGQTDCDPLTLTAEQIRAQFARRKQETPGLTQTEIARQAGMSPSVLSKILNRQRPLKPQEQLNLYETLFVNGQAARGEGREDEQQEVHERQEAQGRKR